MGRWLIPGIGAIVLAVAVVTGAVVWAQQGSAGACDQGLLAESIANGIDQADRDGRMEFMPENASSCSDDQMAAALYETTDGWHVMPGGTVMKGSSHHPAQ